MGYVNQRLGTNDETIEAKPCSIFLVKQQTCDVG